jgi:hypothetical protein
MHACRSAQRAARNILLSLAAILATLNLGVTARADDDDEGPEKPVTEIMVTAKRLDAARANIEPSLGASTYTVTNDTIENRPGGETGSINISSFRPQGSFRTALGNCTFANPMAISSIESTMSSSRNLAA